MSHFGFVMAFRTTRGLLGLGLVLVVAGVAKAGPPANFEIVPRKLIQEMSASSEAPGHPVSRLRDRRERTAWQSRPGDAKGVTVTIRYATPRHVAWLTLFPGRVDDASVARPVAVTVLWEGGEQRGGVSALRENLQGRPWPLARGWGLPRECKATGHVKS